MLQKHLLVCMIDISYGLETDTDTSPDKGWKGSDSFSKSLGAPYHFQLPFILDFSTAVWLEILELPQGSRAQRGTDCRERSLLLKMK